MAATPSNMMPLGTKAPDFELQDAVTGKLITFQSIRSKKATVVAFICNHCPYVIHILDTLVRLGYDFIPHDISFVMISSNDVSNYPQDSPENMKKLALEKHFPFPYLYDESQQVAKAYKAACTPDFYIFDKNDKCIYRGQFDDSRPGNNVPVTGKDIRNALNAVLNETPIPDDQKPSIGCNIKWKNGL